MNKIIIKLVIILLFTFSYLLAINIDENTYINTKNITYDKNSNSIELGESSLINIKDINILTDQGLIDYNKKSIEIKGSFYFYQNENVLSGENLNGNIDLTNFYANKISYIYNNDLKIDAKNVQRVDNIITFTDSFLTPCEIDGFFKCPTWSIKVPKTNYNIDDDKFEHYDLFLQIADYKVFYTPYFSHYGSKAGRKNGFLYPSIDFDIISKRSALTTPYYFPYSQSTDITFTPSYSINDELALNNYEHLIQFNNKSTGGDTNIQIFNEFHEDSNTPFSTLRIDSNQTLSREMNFSLNLMSTNNISKTRSDNITSIPFDSLFVKTENYNFLKKDDLLISKLSTVTSYSNSNNTSIPIELPSVQYLNNYEINKNITGLNNIKLSYLKRDESSVGLPSENKKITINTMLLDNIYLNDLTIFNKLSYYINYNSTNYSHNTSLNKEKLNSYSVLSSDIRKPINISSDARLKLIIYSDFTNNSFLVNENSNSHSFNYQNLYNDSRISGSDLMDNSNRLVFGLENKFLINNKTLRLNIAQSYDSKLNSNYLNKIKQKNNLSDIAFESKINFDNFSFQFDSRNNYKTLSKKELNYSLNILRPINLNLKYNETEKDAYENLTNDSKSLMISTSKQFNNNFQLGFSSNLDLKEEYKPYKQSVFISFFDECSKFNITYTNSRFNDNFNTKPTETVRFEFYMDYLGFIGYEQSTDLINKSKTESYFSSTLL